MHVVRALVGVDRLEVHHMANDVVLVRHTVGSQNITSYIHPSIDSSIHRSIPAHHQYSCTFLLLGVTRKQRIQHSTCTSNLDGLDARVALHERDQLDRQLALILQATDAQASLQRETDLGLHVGKLALDQLGRCERVAKLLAI